MFSTRGRFTHEMSHRILYIGGYAASHCKNFGTSREIDRRIGCARLRPHHRCKGPGVLRRGPRPQSLQRSAHRPRSVFEKHVKQTLIFLGLLALLLLRFFHLRGFLHLLRLLRFLRLGGRLVRLGAALFRWRFQGRAPAGARRCLPLRGAETLG